MQIVVWRICVYDSNISACEWENYEKKAGYNLILHNTTKTILVFHYQIPMLYYNRIKIFQSVDRNKINNYYELGFVVITFLKQNLFIYCR